MRWITFFLREQGPPGGYSDVYWGLLTIALSVAVVVGYGVIAFQWFFQLKLSERATARAALSRLRTVAVCCAVLGLAFAWFDLPRYRFLWRVYDLLLLLVVGYTWLFALRMRGIGLVDERLAHVAELEQSVGRYRDIAELLPNVVWTATARGEIDYANRRWTEYADAGRSWLDAVEGPEAPEVKAAWEEAVRDRLPFESEARLRGREGVRTFVVRATPIFHGEAVKWLGACADVEDQKRLAAEQELQARQKAFFLNALSHDLRAPLNNIALNAHLLKRAARDEEEAEMVKTIGENAAAAGRMLSTLLEFAKAGHEANVVERVSVTTVLEQVRRRFAPLAAQKGLSLVAGEQEEVVCHTDLHKLERIVSNLVDNAVKYTRQGGIEISARTAAGKVSVFVTDTGEGVPRESAAFLFDEFYQVDNHERDRSKGFGLGLAICRSLARQLGGDVRLVRTGSDGSCFEICVRDERPGRGGRNNGQEGDRTHPAATELCSA